VRHGCWRSSSLADMHGKRDEEWRSATRIALRFFGLSAKPNVAPWKLVAALIVAGAAVLAVSPRHSYVESSPAESMPDHP
jgi:hypothetical protein